MEEISNHLRPEDLERIQVLTEERGAQDGCGASGQEW